MFPIPEGPEVEAVKRDLEKLLTYTVTKAYLTPLALKYNRYIKQQENISVLQGKTIETIERRGKFIIWWFDDIPVVNHLGMTGGWIIQKVADALSKYPKVVLEFSNQTRAIFDDIRNFGRFEIFKDEGDLLKQTESIRTLGVNGLAEPFPQKKFEELLQLPRNQNKQIGSLLLDQRVVAGVGNIYKSESLFKANIHPVIPVNELTREEIKKLGLSISEILQLALAYGGSTIDTFQLPFGAEGKAQNWHRVYGQDSKPCSVCKTPIERIIQNTRSTFFCPTCQPLREGMVIPEANIPKKNNKQKTTSKTKKQQKKPKKTSKSTTPKKSKKAPTKTSKKTLKKR